MHTLSTVFDHLGSYFVSRTYGFPSLWSFCQQQMQPTIMMTVTLLNSLAQLCRVLRLVSDCCTANFLNSKFLTHKLTSFTVSDSHCMLPLVSFTSFKCSRRLALPSCCGLYPFSKRPSSHAPFSLPSLSSLQLFKFQKSCLTILTLFSYSKFLVF